MTREEAVNELNDRIKWAEYVDSDYIDVSVDAVKMAISALSVPETNVGDTIYGQAAIEAIKALLEVLRQEHRYKIPGEMETYSEYNEAWQDALNRAEIVIENWLSAQPDIARSIATIIENEKDMRVILKNAQIEPLTDKEQRIFLAAMGREKRVCEEVDRNYVNEPYEDSLYEDSLMKVCNEIERKVKGACFVNTKISHLR